MRYTTVIWEPPCTDEQSTQVREKLESLALEGVVIGTLVLNRESTRDVATRPWLDLATAESWCEFVLSVGASSAIVDPE